MKPAKFQDLGASVGDAIIAVNCPSEMYTEGAIYEVEENENGVVCVMTDCGYYATTSATEFVFVTDGATAEIVEEVPFDVAETFLAPTDSAPVIVEMIRFTTGEVVASVKDTLVKASKDFTVTALRSRSPPYARAA